MKLSKKVWEDSQPIIQAIKDHPFNLELAKGTLSLDRFGYYIEQDSLYLKEFGRCHAMIAARGPAEYVRLFLKYSDYTFLAEQELVHGFFRKAFQLVETHRVTPATLAYTSYLLKVCALEPIEIGIAALLPCFWVYREVGTSILNFASKENPFSRWIETYGSEDFGSSVEEMITIFDSVGSKATDETCKKMGDAFYTSTVMEWHFWNDAYHKKSLDGFLSIRS